MMWHKKEEMLNFRDNLGSRTVFGITHLFVYSLFCFGWLLPVFVPFLFPLRMLIKVEQFAESGS